MINEEEVNEWDPDDLIIEAFSITEDYEDFDPSFIESVEQFYKENDFLTHKQKIALMNIVNHFELRENCY